MILNLYGGGGSGKTTLQFCLVKLARFEKLVPFTTRPKRREEQEGVHYHFVTEEAFLKKGLILQRSSNGFLYGIRREDLENHRVMVTTFDLTGVRALEAMGFTIKIVFLNIAEEERKSRMITRGDDLDLIIGRIQEDRNRIVVPKNNCPILELQGGTREEVFTQVLDFV